MAATQFKDNAILAGALGYAERGWQVLPIEPGTKRPLGTLVPHGVSEATSDPVTISRWWGLRPDASVGIRTGGGLVVVDVDPQHGGDDTWGSLEVKLGLPRSPTANTPQGGFHAYYEAPPGVTIRNSAGKLGPGVDVRADGGYVVAPPSSGPDGRRGYAWEPGLAPDDVPLPQLPGWLIDLLMAPDRPRTDRTIREGNRNSTLTSMAGAMRRRGMSAAAIEAALVVENQEHCHPRLGDPEVHEIAISVARYAPAVARSQPDGAQDHRADAEPGGTPWPPRKDLPKPEPTPQLPAELVPGPWCPWLVDAAERAKLPLEYLAAPAIVAAGNVIGRQLAIRPNQFDDFLVVANLWGAIVGPSGDMKTQAIAEGTRPAVALAYEATCAYEQEVKENVSALERIELEMKAIKDRLRLAAKAGKTGAMDDAEDELRTKHDEAAKLAVVERRYLTQDSTVAKLGELLRDNPRGLLVLRDELTGLLRMMDQPGHEGDREFFLEGWNGTNAYTFDRIGRGTIHIPALCLGLFGGIQPGKLRRYVTEAVLGGWGADGLLQRLQILVWPDALPPWQRPHRWPNGEARARAIECFRGLDCLDPGTLSADRPAYGLPFLTFAPDGQELYDAFRDKLEGHLRGGTYSDAPAFASHLAKYRSLLPALALTFHLIEIVGGGAAGPVCFEATQLAAAWVEFLERHARKVYSDELDLGAGAAAALADRIEKGQIPDHSSTRDLYRHGWTGLTDPERVRAGLTVLVGVGWVRIVDVVDPAGGRPSEVIRLHPELRVNGGGQEA